jgi:hypothetical protein
LDRLFTLQIARLKRPITLQPTKQNMMGLLTAENSGRIRVIAALFF